ncbi:TPA: hypothetical protein N0F65_010489 [Lagenidium giganteum]|uniref:Transmembrane protein 198 n=1 Tax=Lagenidium giganteum TaxID=4803 RepID=A0AAV2Z9G6_9STRA|nr:TPA: hypothetical protein N0F65_010489 [Lagenidium giganteum]
MARSPSIPLAPLQLLLLLVQLVSLTAVTASSNNGTATDTIFDSTKGIKFGHVVTAGIAIAGGTVLCFFGYRLIRPALFACAFVFGGILLAGLAEYAFRHKSWMSTASWVCFLIGGLIAGAVIVWAYRLGIFMAGATAGVLLAFTVNTSFGHHLYPSNPNVVVVLLALVFGIIGGILAIKIERPMLIVATSLVGAQVLVWGVGYFAGHYPNGADLERFAHQQSDGKWIYHIPSAWWAYLAGIIVLWCLGMYIQFHKTARDTYHSRSNQPHQQQHASGHAQYHASQTPRYGNSVSHV